MSIFTRPRAYTDAFVARQNGVPLNDLIETRAKTLMEKGPLDRGRFHYTVQPDGKVVTSEIVLDDAESTDEQSVRMSNGDRHSDGLQEKTRKLSEEISRCELIIREMHENLIDLRDRRAGLTGQLSEYRMGRRDALVSLAIFLAIALGEITALLVPMSDLFGVDPSRLISEVSRNPIMFLLVVSTTTGLFLFSLLIAERAIGPKNQLPWILGLVLIAVGIGKLRTLQAVAMQEVDPNMKIYTLIFTVISFGFPIAAAVYKKKWSDSRKSNASADGMMRQLQEEEAVFTRSMDEAELRRRDAMKERDDITKEYRESFQQVNKKKDRAKADLEQHARSVEGCLAELRLAYIFWDGWSARGMSFTQPLKIWIVTIALLAVIAWLLTGCADRTNTGSYNVELICDRSSSGSEYSCTPLLIAKAGRMWVKRADDRGGGGRFDVLLMDKGFDSTTVLFSEDYPSRFPGPVLAHKKKWREEFIRRLTEQTGKLPTDKGSAVAEAICRAALRAGKRGETDIFVLSDMREVDGAYNFERRVPDEKEFLNWLDRKDIKPNFTGETRLVISGLHPYTPDKTSRMTPENYDRLIRLWRAVFEKWGVSATISEGYDFGE